MQRHNYCIVAWDKKLKIGKPIHTACRPSELPKLKLGQWYGFLNTSLNRRINSKG